VFVREHPVERHGRRDTATTRRGVDRVGAAHAEADDADAAPGDGRMRSESIDCVLHVDDHLRIGERSDPRTGIADLRLGRAPVEIHCERREAVASEAAREIAGVIGEAPDVVDHDDAGMRFACTMREEAEIDGRRVVIAVRRHDQGQTHGASA